MAFTLGRTPASRAFCSTKAYRVKLGVLAAMALWMVSVSRLRTRYSASWAFISLRIFSWASMAFATRSRSSQKGRIANWTRTTRTTIPVPARI